MPVDVNFLNLIGDLYAATTDPSMWEQALRRLVDAFSSTAAYLFVIDSRTVTASQHLTVGLSEETMREYGADAIKICPRYRCQLEHPERKILYDYQHTSEENIDRHPFYAWLNKSAGTTNCKDTHSNRRPIRTNVQSEMRTSFSSMVRRKREGGFKAGRMLCC